jgi:multisubunit Na+/H+ antiporter MnhG subunit
MKPLTKHAVLSAVGLLLGIALVAILSPQEKGGTMLIVVCSLLVTNAIGAIVARR